MCSTERVADTINYLALLRGINVGGNNIIKMDALRTLFEGLGFTGVTTYIQSGNVLFKSPRHDRRHLEEHIERALREKVGGSIRVALLTSAEMEEIIVQKPEGFGENKEAYRYDVIFLMGTLTASDAIKEFRPREGVDTISEGKKVLYIARLVSQITKSRFSKISESWIYPDITIRNWNTTETLCRLVRGNA
ncbi:MAG: DUF1697 domain-containing protein [Spirochaetaceae bacterium]|jgi:uncharacterized protein (DUF1697 family)|nr:DUF1697 domain-containing protein [Spirochaetaceae bacterium]